jgi:arylsulfatase A-like enzyme
MRGQLSNIRWYLPRRRGVNQLFWGSILCSLMITGRSNAGFTQSAKPNIILILADDLGYGELSGYGAKDCRTPMLDSLRRAGLKFTHFYANSTVCSPTRAALLTGRYPDLVGVPGVIRSNRNNSWGYLSPQAVMLPQVLKKAGYHTALVGKWHLGLESPNTPNERGFDLFHGFLEDMMDDYYTHVREGKTWMRLNKQEVFPKGHATDVFTQWAMDYLDDRRKSTSPFFLYLAYNAPHFPVQPPADWLEKVKQRNPALPEKRAKLVALIEHMDAGIGKVLARLRRNGLDKNTLIVFTSDNGGLLQDDANNGGLRGGKQQMFEGGLRVPTLAVWPGNIKAGSSTAVRGISMDLFPTLCEAAGLKPPAPLDGVSLLPTLRGQPQDLNRPLIFVRREGNNYEGQDYYAILLNNWKMLQNSPFEPFELYNLEQDPAESKNVKKENLEIYHRTTTLLRDHLLRAGSVPWQAPAVAK